MKKVLTLILAAFVYGIASVSAQSTDALKQKAFKLMESVEGATPVEQTDNRLMLYVDSIVKIDGGYDVYMDCHNPQVRNAGSGTVMATVFVDPENYENTYLPYTIDEKGFMKFSFVSTPEGGAIIPVKFEPASKVMYVYFKGVTKPAELRTVPMFYTVVLGDKPFVVEKEPRHAGTTFEKTLK